MKSFKTLLIAGLILILAGSAAYALDCNVSFTSVLKMQNSGYCQVNDWVIDNQTDFCTFWDRAYMLVYPAPPCPDIDFSTYVVIVTAMGRKSNGCYDTEIHCIEGPARELHRLRQRLLSQKGMVLSHDDGLPGSCG